MPSGSSSSLRPVAASRALHSSTGAAPAQAAVLLPATASAPASPQEKYGCSSSAGKLAELEMPPVSRAQQQTRLPWAASDLHRSMRGSSRAERAAPAAPFGH